MNDFYAAQGYTADAVQVVLDAEPDAAYPPDLPVPYTLTPQAEELLATAEPEPEAGQ